MSCKRSTEATFAHFMGHFVSFLTSKVRKMSKTMAHFSSISKMSKKSFCFRVTQKYQIFAGRQKKKLSRPSKYLDKMP